MQAGTEARFNILTAYFLYHKGSFFSKAGEAGPPGR